MHHFLSDFQDLIYIISFLWEILVLFPPEQLLFICYVSYGNSPPLKGYGLHSSGYVLWGHLEFPDHRENLLQFAEVSCFVVCLLQHAVSSTKTKTTKTELHKDWDQVWDWDLLQDLAYWCKGMHYDSWKSQFIEKGWKAEIMHPHQFPIHVSPIKLMNRHS